MISFSVPISMPTPPRCPVCQRELDPRGFWVTDGVAFCMDCAKECTHDALRLEIDCADAFSNMSPYHCVHGVTFHCPAESATHDRTAAEQLADHEPRPPLYPTSLLEFANQRDARAATSPIASAEPPPRRARPRRTLSADDPDQTAFEFDVSGQLIADTHPT